MRFLLTISLAFWLNTAHADSIRILVQNSPLAGSQYYALGDFWTRIKLGDRLELIREANNRHDRNAIRVNWNGHQLGYVPLAENPALAAAMDAGERLSGRVSGLSDNKNPWQRLAFEVFIEL
ncbi:HIRAN domain-containing protein [Dechloromonas sp. HYN0024]|uniref:HIRAN domain-containing protein n=1 Tax=Dechloromonas sp. HYN0024 TaxID=2231055 RepID=UPI000E44B175|nr:HIRAN domain-containing protein [Dechloromonas sp. HYN0024]AXS78938.1 HIRAN protein [Dechloromonas sp. HYN0024]